MATQQEINQIAGLYVGYFDRAPDPAGLQFWIDQLDDGREFSTISQDFAQSFEALALYPFLLDTSSTSSAAFVTSIYVNLFGRTPEQAGLDFWVDVLDDGDVLPGDMVEAVLNGARDAVVDGTFVFDATIVDNRIDCALAWTNAANAQAAADNVTFDFNASAMASAKAAVSGIDETQASVDAVKAQIAAFFDGGGEIVLEQSTVEISPAVAGTLVTETVTYWGYNPNLDGQSNVDNTANGNTNNLFNENAADGGIPADEFFGTPTANPPFSDGYLYAATGETLGSIFNFTAVNVDTETVTAALTGGNITQTGDGNSVTITFADGSQDDIAIIEGFYDLVNDLFFDAEGNTRFFEVEVASQVPVYITSTGGTSTDPIDAANSTNPANSIIGSVDAVLGGSSAVTAAVPIVLTQTDSTQSDGARTSASDDFIQAGTLDMLHQSTIDGGPGNNTLSIEAKGEFAQPKLLANIQQVTIENLPNIYEITSVSPTPIGGSSNPDTDSVLDLSTANQLVNVTITEGDYTALDSTATTAGQLTVSGVSNNATVTFQGGFNNGNVNVFTSTGTTSPTFIFDNVNSDVTFNLGQNGAAMTFQANGISNNLQNVDSLNNLAGVTDLTITGAGSLFIESDLDQIFENDTPITINAAANSGGVNLNVGSASPIAGPEQLTFVGSSASDRLAVVTADSDVTNGGPTASGDFNDDQFVSITNSAGDNYYDILTYALSVVDGDGNNNVEFDAATATISAGDGNNLVQGKAAESVVTLGSGDNRIDIEMFNSPNSQVFSNSPFLGLSDFDQKIDITAGDGANMVNLFASGITNTGSILDVADIDINLGNGGNTINIPALPLTPVTGPINIAQGSALSDVNITTGDGDDTMLVGGSNITISSGGGNDTITLLGIDNDYVTAVNGTKELVESTFGALLDIDTGTGSATINLGASNVAVAGADGFLVAKDGSTITGSDVSLFVDTNVDLRAASLSGITSIVLDDDATTYVGQGFPTALTPSNAASLTLLDTQVVALGNSVFSTQGEAFGAQSVLNIVVTADATLSSLIDLTTWNDSIKFCFIVEEGVILTLSAQELDQYVAPNGIYLIEGANNAQINNQVVITDAGPDFNAYNGGTFNGGSVQGAANDANGGVTVIYTPDGYERPTLPGNSQQISWDSDQTAVVSEVKYPFANDLDIEGSADLTITAPIYLSDNFTIDFSTLGGTFTDTAEGGAAVITIADFQAMTGNVNTLPNVPNNGTLEDIDATQPGVQPIDPSTWGRIDGNGTSAAPVRVELLMQDGTSAGDSDLGVLDGGIKSSGVQQYVLVGFNDDDMVTQSQSGSFTATIVVCDNTADLEVLGLQNNRESTVTFEQVNWNTTLLFEGDGYANASDQEKNLGNPDLSEVGTIVANFFEPGVNADIRITNQGTQLGQNQDAEDGFDPDGERILDVAGIVVTNAKRMLINVEDGDAKINNISGIDPNGNSVERLLVTGPEDVEIVVNGINTPNATSFDDDLVTIDGSNVTDTFKLTFTEDTDLSSITVTGVDAISLAANVALTMTADQVVALGGLVVSEGAGTSLSVVGLSTQALDLTTVDVASIGTVTFADIDGTIVVDAATNFDGATSAIIVASSSDTTVQMTVTQLGTITGNTVTINESNGNDGTLSLTEIPTSGTLDLTNVDAVDNDGAIQLVATDYVPADDFFLLFDGGLDEVDFVLSGASDLTALVTMSNLTSLQGPVDIPEIILQDSATLTVTSTQLAQIIATAGPNADGITVSGSATLNVTDWNALSATDLTQLVADNPGLSIGNVFIEDNNTAFTINAAATFGGGMVVTPTASPNEGAEGTEITMTVAQYQTTSGDITGDGTVNLSGAANNNDSDADNVNDNFVLDVSGITANRGELSILETGANPQDNGETLALDASTDISGFDIILTDGQVIEFATEAQAATTVDEQVVSPNNPTAIVWAFETVTGPVDTSGYDAAIETLFVPEVLVDGVNEEDLWTTLAGSIVVQKYNDAAPRGLVAFDRINTFEAFGAALNGITFDDQDEFETIGSLELNLEGNVSLGGVTINETNGESGFGNPSGPSLQINSYLDAENLPSTVTADGTVPDPNGTITDVIGVTLLPNTVGDINLLSEVRDGVEVEIEINTGTQTDNNVASGQGPNSFTADLDAGQAVSVGTIFLGTPASGVSTALIDLNGDNNVSITAVDLSDPALTQVNIDTQGMLTNVLTGPALTIGGVNYNALVDNMGITNANALDAVVKIDDLTATASTDLNPATGTAATDAVLLEISGTNDLKAIDVSTAANANANFNIDGVYAVEAGTLSLTGAQIAAIGIVDANNDGVADNWVLGPGVAANSVTINICDLNNVAIDLDAIAAAGFNIGAITIDEDTTLAAATTLGGADSLTIELGSADTNISLEMTAAQYNGFSGVITEQLSANPVNPTATYTAQVVIDQLEAIEDTSGQVTINLSTVATTGANSVLLSARQVSVASTANVVAPLPSATAVANGDNDVTLSTATNLGTFGVVLNDVENATSSPTPNEQSGQSVRFTTVEQADGRTVTIVEAEASDDEQDTNVVWTFDTIPGPNGLDVSNYDDTLGRIWVGQDLVNSVNGDIDSLFTIDNNGTLEFTLDQDIIKRVTNDDPLTTTLVNSPVNQRIELEAGVTITNLTTQINDPSQYIETLRIDAGGLVTAGDLVIDNLVGPNILGDDDFIRVTINSFLADFYNSASDKHYLLPDIFNPSTQSLPSDSQQFPDPANTFGDILAGGNRGVLREVVINTGNSDAVLAITPDAADDNDETVTITYTVNGGAAQTISALALTDPTDAVLTAEEIAAAIDAETGVSATSNGSRVIVNSDGNGNGDDDIEITNVVFGGTTAGLASTTSDNDDERGADFVAGTLFLSEDTTPITNAGLIDINGNNDVTLKSIDSTDAEITSVTLDTAGHTGTVTVTGGSPALDGGDVASDTQTLTFQNNNSDTGVITFASTIVEDDTTTPADEFDILYTTGTGQPAPWAGVSSAALEVIDTTAHGGTISLGVISEVNGDTFALNAGVAGQVYACLGQGIDDGNVETPTLNANGTWTFNGATVATNDNSVDLEMKQVNLGAGTLALNNVDVTISGAVDFTSLAALTPTGTTTFVVEASGTLTLTVEQVTALDFNNYVITGEGMVVVTGESDTSVAAQNGDFGNLRTATVDLSAVTLDANDAVLEIEANGATQIDGTTPLLDDNAMRVTQTIIGSANDDAVTVTTTADDTDTATVDVILQLGADGGTIGVPEETPSANTATDATPEVAGDTINLGNAGVANVLIDVDAGYDSVVTTATGGLDTGDTVQVAAGAEFYAGKIDGNGFTATADDSNDGIAVIEADGDVNEDFDMSLATGTNGWYIIGAADSTTGSETDFTGSAQADFLIDGLADDPDNDGDEDTFIGGAGSDAFVFNFASSDPATLTQAPNTAAVDAETITVTADGADEDNEQILISYRVGNAINSFVFEDGGLTTDIDFADANATAAALALELDAISGITATANAADVTITGDNGASVELISATTVGGVVTTFAATTSNTGPDTPGIIDVTVAFPTTTQTTAVAGEVYTLSVMLSEGTDIIASFTAAGSETAAQLATALAAAFTTNAGAVPAPNTNGVTAASPTPGVIRLTDQNPDNGGFTVTTANGSATVNASSASSVISGTLQGTVADADADTILDFVSADDSISFGLAAGTNNNYDEEGYQADFDTAQGNADAAFANDQDLVYFLSGSVAGNTGLLFVNLDGDGTADAVVSLVGIDNTNFDEADIV